MNGIRSRILMAIAAIPLAIAGANEPTRTNGSPSTQSPVQFHPARTAVAGLESHTLCLDGRWHFTYQPPTGFPADTNTWTAWEEVPAPSRSHKRGNHVGYGHAFEVPAAWKDYHVRLRFGSVEGAASISLNGKTVGTHDGPYVDFELPVDDAVQTGARNILTMIVTNSPINKKSGRDVGGISHSVYLYAVPRVHISRLHVVT